MMPSKDSPVPPEAILGRVVFGWSGTHSRTVPSWTLSPKLQLDWCITGISCFGSSHQQAGSCGQCREKGAHGAPHCLGMVNSLLRGSGLDPPMPWGSGSPLGPSLLIWECNTVHSQCCPGASKQISPALAFLLHLQSRDSERHSQ